jgi:hypothetical protein
VGKRKNLPLHSVNFSKTPNYAQLKGKLRMIIIHPEVYMISIKLPFIVVLLSSQLALATNSSENDLFKMTKSFHSKNILYFTTEVDESCKFVQKDNQLTGYHWMLDGKKRKEESEDSFREQVRAQTTVLGINDSSDSLKIKMNQLINLEPALESNIVDVSSSYENGSCQVKTILSLADGRKMKLENVYCKVITKMLIPTGECEFFDLVGKDDDTGKDLKIRFTKK